MRGALLVMLAVLSVGCARRRMYPAPPPETLTQRKVEVEGRRWIVTHDVELPLLRRGARLLGMIHVEAAGSCPLDETVFVQAEGGRIVAIHHAADLRPFVAPITKAEQALDYAKFLRVFPIPQSEAPGMVRGSPDRGGVIPEMMDEALKEEGIDPAPTITSVPGGFELVRLVVMREGNGPARLVRIRERVGTDGEHAAEILATVPTKARVEDWIWEAC